MARNADKLTSAAHAAMPAGMPSRLTDTAARGSVRSAHVNRDEMPRLLLSAVSADVRGALPCGTGKNETLSLLLRRLENEYRKHWLINVPAN